MSTSAPNSFLDRPPVLYVWRPFYRWVMTPFILPVLSAVRSYMLAPNEQQARLVNTQIEQLRVELSEVRAKLDGISAEATGVVAKIDATYLDSLSQWGAMEHLIVSSLRLSDRAATKRANVLERLEVRQNAITPALERLIQAVEECRAEQGVLASALQRDQDKTWRELENLVMSLLAQHGGRSATTGR